MRVCLIKRGKITHVGFKAEVDGEIGVYSLCNKKWDCKDVLFIGEHTEITCKRCSKRMARADEDGRVIL